MSWIEIHIITTAEYAEELSRHLSLEGANAVTWQDAGDQPIYEPSAATPRIWAETTLIGLFPSDYPLAPLTAYLAARQALGHITAFHTHRLEDEDWVRRSLDSFKPLCFGKRLWICPSWHQPPDPRAVNVILDPGLAFGTGTHPTTALCLEWLDQHVHHQALAIDYGCGSGILGIAAYQLGVKRVIAVDNDPQALTATAQNAARNQISDTVFTTQLASAPLRAQADIVLANILAQPLIDLANHLSEQTMSGGCLVLSGILRSQLDVVKAAYAPWFDMQPPAFKEEWGRLVGIKRKTE